MTTPSGRALAGMLAFFAEFEREILRDRVKAGIADARKESLTADHFPPTSTTLTPTVPAKIRGAKKNGPFWCVNVCEHVMIYRNVTLLTGATASQTSDPAAIITFSRPECKVAVAEANKTVLDIKR